MTDHTDMTDAGITLTPQQAQRRRTRSIAIGVSLAALVVLFYVVTIAKMGINLESAGG